MTSLPPVRRIITSHKPSGEPDVQDDSPMTMPVGPGMFHLAYVQKGLPADPALAIEGGKSMPDAGFTQSDGVIVGFLDFTPGMKTAMHYTNTYDYIVVTVGQLLLTLHDGSTKTVRVGELIVQTGNVHQLANETQEAARALTISVPAKPRQINGKGIGEALGAKEGGC